MAPKIHEKKRKAESLAAEAEAAAAASDDEGSLDGLLDAVLSDSEDESDEEYVGDSEDSVDGDEEKDWESDDVPSEGDEEDGDEDGEDDGNTEWKKKQSSLGHDGDDGDEMAKLNWNEGAVASEEKTDNAEDDSDEADRPNYRVTTDANGGVRYVYDEIDPVYDSDDSAAAEPANTIGNIPLSFYDSYPHIGYDINGKKIMRPATGEALDALLDSIDLPKGWTGLTDPATGKPLRLSQDELELLRRVQMNEIPEEGYDPYPDMVEYFSSIEEKMPLSAAPEPKRRWLPSKHEAVRIAKLVRAIREGRILPYKPPGQEDEEETEVQQYDLWQDEQPREPHVMHIPAPKLPLPGHSESYNCPPEYVPTEAERTAWENTDPEDREQAFLPAKYDALRKVPGYGRFVNERFERCLDLYLAPRVRRNKLQIDPNALLPKLPPANELKPFPTVCQTIFRGHTGWVRSVAVDPTGCWLASGGDDGTVRLWELLTGRQVWSARLSAGREHDEEVVNCIAWRPGRGTASILAAAVGEDLFFMVPSVAVDPEMDRASRALLDAGFGYAATNGRQQKEAVTGATPAGKWTRPGNARLESAGVLLQVRVRAPIKTVSWHRRGDHLVTVAPTGGRSAVAVHTLSRHATHVPFRRLANIPQTACFHPSQPQLFLATKQQVRVYDLAKMELVKTIRPGCRLISSLDVHPANGDHVVIGAFDRRLVWHDVDLASSPLRTMRYHDRAVRAVAFHRGSGGNHLPLLADASDDGSLQIYFARVYSDSLEPPTIVPVKKLATGGHRVVDAVGVLDVTWHPQEAWCVSAGADGTCRLWM